MKRIISFISVFVIMTACKEANISANNVEALISFGVVDQNDNDLIEQGLINEEDITVYLKNENVEYKVYYDALKSDPKGIFISPNTKDTFGYRTVGFYPTTGRIDDASSHIIDWGIDGFKKDTLDCKFENNPGSLILTEVKLNGEDFWKRGDVIEETLKVVKHVE